MGAEYFTASAEGRTARAAFNRARDDALYEYGHGGYTGTIAEKDDFVMFEEVEPMEAGEADGWAWSPEVRDDARVADKWGPCGCIPLAEGGWLFFGWASS